jgi:uncharacterized membrane protein
MLTETVSFIFYTWLVSLLLQLSGVVWLIPSASNQLKDKGWALGRILSWLCIGFTVWFLAHFKLPVNTGMAITIISILFFGSSVWYAHKNQTKLRRFFVTHKLWITLQEILFLIGLVSLTLIRGFNPDIRDLEKPMDAGFMASYLRSPTLPAKDMWLAGETINYYSFGHYLGSIFSQIAHLDISYSYNLLLAYILGLSLSISFSIGINVLDKTYPDSRRWSPFVLTGLLASFFVAVGGNSHTIWYRLSHGSWEGYWYADATRFIETTIHEFPSYSFVVADIHAHVWNLPLVLSFFVVLIHWLTVIFTVPQKNIMPAKFSSKPLKKWLIKTVPVLKASLILGVFIGTFAMTNTWDALIYPLLLVVVGFIIVILDYRRLSLLILSAVSAIFTAIIIALPWYLNFSSISEGIAKATQHSPLWQLAVLWTGHLTLSLLGLMLVLFLYGKSTKRQPQISATLILGLTLTAWLLILLPELMYFKDIYSGHPRANTMFKLTYQAFIMMGLVGAWFAGATVHTYKLHRGLKLALLALVFLITLSLAAFPYFAYRGYYNNLKGFKGIHGYQWLKEKQPSDYAAIVWLKQSVKGQPVILEAVGESYTEYNQVSAITGLPAVLGWRVHEWLWRGGFEIPGARTEEVKTIYTNPGSSEARRLLDLYQVEYIFVGSNEYQNYPSLNPTLLKALGEVVYSHGSTFIIKRTGS